MDTQAPRKSENISKKLAQLDAMMTIAASEQFNDFTDITKADALWLCKDLTTEIKQEFDSIGGDIPITSQD